MVQDWVAVALTAALVGVTAWYALLTHRLARSSAAAAESAAESARAAADSARSQRAAIEADLSQRHAWFKTAGGGASFQDWSMWVRPLVGAYVLRRVVLLEFEFMPDTPGEDGSRSSRHVEVRENLTPVNGDLPMPVDEIGGAEFKVDVAALARRAIPDDTWTILDWSCEVTYSISSFTEIERRTIVHLDPERDPRSHWIREARERGFL
jgi:hypothetical protein